MVDGVGVSDEQLDEPMSERSLAAWEQFLSVPREVGMNSRTALALLGEVRASRAREAEQADGLDRWQGVAAAAIARKVVAEAERDALQERIDKALAVLVDADAVSEYLRMGVRGLVETESVRAALTGTDNQSTEETR